MRKRGGRDYKKRSPKAELPISQHPEAQRDTTYATAGFFHLLHAEDPTSFRAIVEEAGGTLNDLAVLVVKHFRRAIPRRTAHYPFFAFIAPFLKEIRDEAEIPFDAALRANGFVGALVLAMLELSDGLHSGVPALRSTLLTQLERCLIPPPGYVALTEALDAGLLPLLIICARFPSHGRTGDKLQALITMVSHGTVFYPVMSRLAQYVDYADPLTQDPTFQRSSSYAAWKHFRGLYEERLVVLQQFDSRSSASLKACDNLECDLVGRLKHELKRCVVCQTAYYCSRKCQTIDWRAGHRVACPHLRALRLAEPPLSPRARAFMRALVHHEYIANQSDLVRRQLAFRSANPDTDYYVAFDHVETGDGTMLLGLQAIPDVEDLWRFSSRASSDWAVVWKEAVARSRRSRGTLELHLLVVKEGWETRMRLFPMRTISGRRGIPELEDGIQIH
ncbi:hypothetical protein C8R46DRAFT_1231364 [Mycena filopes]|nr:hypothetical protein C8R46DRAFT_1231364 [Mycena filopes]